ncbi:uncharacterized protein LOC115927535 [Strongylocentrotus purpuratus]|uniref:MAM domain-containing protein n=1 Tax=Strongylocentrotus purpuratus TaxID=7668 RepID=A0A7M7PF77_STRPU|nr:uncharacterized protein LOC115927535 [Strongylocentrotus purpuratus]
MWVKKAITLNSDEIFQVIIEGVKGEGSSGHLAIDDTTFTPECSASGSSLPAFTTMAPTTATVPATKPKSSAGTSSSSTPSTTSEETTGQQATHSPYTSNTGLIAGLSATFGIIFFIVVVLSLLFWRKRRSGKGDLGPLKKNMENPGFDKDFGNPNFALQEVDTSMFGEYPSEGMPSSGGIDNPVYASPARLPIDEHTDA